MREQRHCVPIIVLSIAALSADNLAAQRKESVAVGDRVRVTTTYGSRLIGRVAATTVDTLSVTSERGFVPHQLPTLDLVSLEVQRGRSHVQGAILGGFLGFLGGAAVGGVTGLIAGGGAGSEPNGFAVVVLGAAGGGLGLLSGTVIGAVRGVDAWRPVR